MFDKQLPSSAMWIITNHHFNPTVPVAMLIGLETDQDDRPAEAHCYAHFNDCHHNDVGTFPFTLKHPHPSRRVEGFDFDPMAGTWHQIGSCILTLFLTRLFCSPYKEENWEEFITRYPHLRHAHRLAKLRMVTRERKELEFQYAENRMCLSDTFSGMFGFLERANVRSRCESLNLQQLYEFFNHRPDPVSMHRSVTFTYWNDPMSQELDLHLLVRNKHFVYGLYLPSFENCVLMFACGQRGVEEAYGHFEFADRESRGFVKVPFFIETVDGSPLPDKLEFELNPNELKEIARSAIMLLDFQTSQATPDLNRMYPGLLNCVRLSTMAFTHPMSWQDEHVLDASDASTYFSHYFPGGIGPDPSDCLGELQYRSARFLRNPENYVPPVKEQTA